MSKIDSALFPPVFPTTWSSEWGEDRYGLFIFLDFKGVRQRFRWIVPGTFMMGSPNSEPQRFEDEIQHEVALTQGFWLADSACTQALWRTVMGDNPSRFQDNAENPVENVSCDDVQQFIERLKAAVPGLEARLPTEAEWEYACRAGTTTPFSFGDNITPEQVNYDGKYHYGEYHYHYGGVIKGLSREKTVPVKTLPPNRSGLYEMHGNIWEWCADWYGPYTAETQTNPIGPKQGSDHVLRGGSWVNFVELTRSARRGRGGPAHHYDLIGFRLALGTKGVSG